MMDGSGSLSLTDSAAVSALGPMLSIDIDRLDSPLVAPRIASVRTRETVAAMPGTLRFI